MNEVISFITENGFYVFLVGIIASILLGIGKTIFRKKFITGEEKDETKENLFDTIVFLSSYVVSFICSFFYILISLRGVNFTEVLKCWLPVWMAQAMAYGIWKKVGLKRLLVYLAKLLIKDENKDGKISIDEVISQLKGAVKDGKLDVDTVVKDITNNIETEFPKVLEEVAKEEEDVEITKEMEDTLEAANGDATDLVEDVKGAIEEIKESGIKETAVIGESDVKVSVGPIIKL